MSAAASSSDKPRKIVWRVFCPRCLRAHENVEHIGTADRITRLDCPQCRKSFTVKSGTGGDGVPICLSTPEFIRKPEVMEDNDPPLTP